MDAILYAPKDESLVPKTIIIFEEIMIVKIKCIQCSKILKLNVEKNEVAPVDCVLAFNVPAVVCNACVDDVLDSVPDPPGLHCTHSMTIDEAYRHVNLGDFIKNQADSVLFFANLFKSDHNFLTYCATCLHKIGEKRKAYSLLGKLIKTDDDQDVLKISLASFYNMDNKPKEAIKVLESVTNKDQKDYYLILGNCMWSINEFENSASCWEKDIEISDEPLRSWLRLVNYYIQIKKDYELALEHVESALRTFGELRVLYGFQGDIFFFQGKYIDAMKSYNKALSVFDDDEDFENAIRLQIQKCENLIGEKV
jgi:tetratricopeptide (TPR) repeat protein